jgi:hypothetical protein
LIICMLFSISVCAASIILLLIHPRVSFDLFLSSYNAYIPLYTANSVLSTLFSDFPYMVIWHQLLLPPPFERSSHHNRQTLSFANLGACYQDPSQCLIVFIAHNGRFYMFADTFFPVRYSLCSKHYTTATAKHWASKT